MGNRRNWFTFVKRLFIPQTLEKKPKRWKCFWGRCKLKKCPAIEPPEKTLSEANEEQRKHALVVAVATAAAAEAAIAAAEAAADVIRLTNAPNEFKMKRINAAIKIQSAYRAHLAKKALSALKGIVKLQAVIRGEIVRRRLIAKLKYMLPLQESKGKVHQIKLPSFEDYHDKRLINSPNQCNKLKLKCKSHRSWDFNLVSEQDSEALWSRRDEASHKRNHLMKYSFSHRERRKDQNLQEFVTSRRRKAELLEKLKSFADSNMTLRNMDDLNSPRRSFSNVKRKSNVDVNSLPSSPIFPTYMAATVSAKAKTRSISTPKQHLKLSETCSGQYSPCNYKLPSWSSLNGETNSRNRNI